MKHYLVSDDPWKVIERGFNPEHNRITESIFSIGNGRFGQRGMFEEHYSGDSLQGTYFAGIYYPDKTKVGWWKIGYPEYFAKVLNAVDWAGLDIYLNDSRLDLAKFQPLEFERVLDMRRGILSRSFSLDTPAGSIAMRFERFCSMDNNEVGAVRCEITSRSFSGEVKISSYLDWDIVNEDANWDESFWSHRASEANSQFCQASAETRKTGFVVSSCAMWSLHGSEVLSVNSEQREKYASNVVGFRLSEGQTAIFEKYTGHCSSMYHDQTVLKAKSIEVAKDAHTAGYEALRDAHVAAWAAKWDEADIVIEGDVSAQQGIRFNIFHMLQTYTGEDARLNIGPKGFTGEKYGGSTYWDTEAYCLPFYLGSGDSSIPRQLLVYRYRHLQKAIENAQKLGFKDGAALYPMVTMNGEECHNEWEITFEEIHRNGAIAYAIYDYINYTGDSDYLLDGGLEVLIGIARFWAQRVNWAEPLQKYVMLGVTGPNEYENNVDNNWYTNYLAAWCLKYARACIESTSDRNRGILEAVALQPGELDRWTDIAENIHLPKDDQKGVFLQQDNYLNKEQLTVDQIPADQRPLNQNWSWDRILRSCFIKQADVLQGLFFFEEQFDLDTIRRNFEFYEPRTVHESSLSPCVHSILACRLNMPEKAYEMYLRTARLDLDDYNNDTDDGLHITSMAGTWMSIVQGFGGVSVVHDKLHISPSLPSQWSGMAFRVHFRGAILDTHIGKGRVRVKNDSDVETSVIINGTEQLLKAGDELELEAGVAMT